MIAEFFNQNQNREYLPNKADSHPRESADFMPYTSIIAIGVCPMA